MLCYCFCCTLAGTLAQKVEVEVELGKTNVSQAEPIILTAIVRNNGERLSVVFPNLPNFTKKAQSSTSKNIEVNGESLVERRISQEYFANRTGAIRVPGFFVKIADENIQVIGFTANIAAGQLSDEDKTFKDFIDGSAYDLVDVKDDAFFAISTNKNRLYVGEGFLLTVAFYIASSNKAELDFVNINQQLDLILKNIRPQNCWEENLNINEVKASTLPVKIAGKNYIQYKIFQAFYYPFNGKPIQVPRQSWTMLKYKIAKDRAVSNAKKEDFKTYSSSAFNIFPQKLPAFVPSENPIVGNFWLEESLSDSILQTGRSFKYNFIIKGDGNTNLIDLPKISADTLFEVFEPKISQNYSTINGKIISEKFFSIDIVPKKAGTFNLGDYFYIPYFNFKTRQLDELRSGLVVRVAGEAIAVQQQNDELDLQGDIYQNIDKIDTTVRRFNISELVYDISYFLILAMLLCFIYIVWPQKNLN